MDITARGTSSLLLTEPTETENTIHILASCLKNSYADKKLFTPGPLGVSLTTKQANARRSSFLWQYLFFLNISFRLHLLFNIVLAVQAMLRDLGSRDSEFLTAVQEVRAGLLEVAAAKPVDWTAVLLQVANAISPQNKLRPFLCFLGFWNFCGGGGAADHGAAGGGAGPPAGKRGLRQADGADVRDC